MVSYTYYKLIIKCLTSFIHYCISKLKQPLLVEANLQYINVTFSPLFFPLQATNEVISRVPKATQEEMSAALDSCSRAFHSWSETSILARQQVFLRYQQLIKDNIVSQRVRKYKVQLKASFLFSAVRLCFIEVEQFDLFLQTSLLNLITLVQNLPFAFDSKMLLQIILNLKIKNKGLTQGSSCVSERTCQGHHGGTGEDPCRCRGGCVQRIA